MPILLGATRSDVLEWSATKELFADVKSLIAENLSRLTSEEGAELLAEIQAALEAEASAEESFTDEFAAILEGVDVADEEMLRLLFERSSVLIADYFNLRHSVVSLHEVSTEFRDRLLCRAITLAEDWLDESGLGRPTIPCAWLSLGNTGRREVNFSSDFKCLMVYDEADAENALRLVGLCRKVTAILEQAGIKSSSGINPVNSPWRGSLAEWRKRVTDGLYSGGEQARSLLILADLRLIAGDGALAYRMLNLIRSMLEYNFGVLREVARSISRMPVGFDFFGRLRLEREGEHRGEFNLERFAWLPLVNNVRIMAIRCNVHETPTLERISALQRQGCLDVNLTENLLHAYHDIVGRMLTLQLEELDGVSAGFFLRTREQSESDSERLKSALEAIAGLERIVYTSYESQG